MYEDDVPFNHAAGYAFLVYTPILILLSWILMLAVDNPAKDLANEVDQASRLKRNDKPKENKPV